MTDSPDTHTPTRDFSEFLARDIVRTLRHDARFAPSARAARARRLGLIVVSIAASVVVLATGLVFGTSTGYASARVESERQHDEIATNTMGVAGQLATLRLDLQRARAELALLATEQGALDPDAIDAANAELSAMAGSVERIEIDLTQSRPKTKQPPAPKSGRMPVKRALAVTFGALAGASAGQATAQQAVPTVDLLPALARTTERLWDVLGVRQVGGGKLLVNDAGGRQLLLFDSTLASSSIALDSNRYGALPAMRSVLIPFRGDSSLFPDPHTGGIRVLDGAGRVARTISLPNIGLDAANAGYIDDRGRLVFAAADKSQFLGDSLTIVRVDLASSRVDTVGRIKDARRPDPRPTPSTGFFTRAGLQQSLIPARDAWAVLSDGSIAFVRGHDYHIDWVRPDGALMSTPKIPFDWQLLAVENKKEAISFARRVPLKTKVFSRDSVVIKQIDALKNQKVAFTKIAINAPWAATRAAIPDLDGNLWILPTAASRSPSDTLVYDVVSRDGALLRRVRLPAGRAVAGFGPGGTVYLVAGIRSTGIHIERTRLPGR